MSRLVLQLPAVERQLMYNSSKLFEKLNKNLVPCLVLRLLVVERHLMHNSNNCNRLIQKEKEKSGAPSSAATPCCGAAPNAKNKINQNKLKPEV